MKSKEVLLVEHVYECAAMEIAMGMVETYPGMSSWYYYQRVAQVHWYAQERLSTARMGIRKVQCRYREELERGDWNKEELDAVFGGSICEMLVIHGVSAPTAERIAAMHLTT